MELGDKAVGALLTTISLTIFTYYTLVKQSIFFFFFALAKAMELN
jgi:Flp pilus assembly pilin Flp